MIKTAIIQVSPVYNSLWGSVEKAVELIKEAASNDARVVAFGETWLGGYPAWLDEAPEIAFWNNDSIKDTYHLMHENSIRMHSDEMLMLCDACRENNVVLVIGANESVYWGSGSGSIYNAVFIIDNDGEILVHHRKLIPTFNERLIYANGDANYLYPVQTDAGKVGALICWEHWMPHARQALHIYGEDIHVALWPSVKEMHLVASRHYAFESRSFVLAVGSIMKVGDVPEFVNLKPELAETPNMYLMNGGSAVIAPDGTIITGPHHDSERIVYTELDSPKQNIREKVTLDVSGHYSRPDIFQLEINRFRQQD